jgi:hypothetical protein
MGRVDGVAKNGSMRRAAGQKIVNVIFGNPSTNGSIRIQYVFVLYRPPASKSSVNGKTAAPCPADGSYFQRPWILIWMAVEKNPWFVAKDVAQALGYVWCGKVMDHIPTEWKLMGSVPTSFGIKPTLTISEEGLYFFLNRSDKPVAIPFQKWVAGTVLPSIRKLGVYMPQGKDDLRKKLWPVTADIYIVGYRNTVTQSLASLPIMTKYSCGPCCPGFSIRTKTDLDHGIDPD